VDDGAGEILEAQEVLRRVNPEAASAVEENQDADVEDKDQEEGTAQVREGHILFTSERPLWFHQHGGPLRGPPVSRVA